LGWFSEFRGVVEFYGWGWEWEWGWVWGVCLGCGFTYGLGAKRCGWFCPGDWKLLSSMTLINGKLTDEKRA